MGLVAPAAPAPEVPDHRLVQDLHGEVPAGQELAENRVGVGGGGGEVPGTHAQQPPGLARVALAPALDQVIPGRGGGQGARGHEGGQDQRISH